jgi:hypothetical protein
MVNLGEGYEKHNCLGDENNVSKKMKIKMEKGLNQV